MLYRQQIFSFSFFLFFSITGCQTQEPANTTPPEPEYWDKQATSLIKISDLLPVTTEVAKDEDFDWRYYLERSDVDAMSGSAKVGAFWDDMGAESAYSGAGRGLSALDPVKQVLYVVTPIRKSSAWELKAFDVKETPPTELAKVDLLALRNSLNDAPIDVWTRMSNGFESGAPVCDDCDASYAYCDIAPKQVTDGNGLHYEFYAPYYVGPTLVPSGCQAQDGAVACTTLGDGCLKVVHLSRWRLNGMQFVAGKLVIQSAGGLNFFDVSDPAAPRFMFAKRANRIDQNTEVQDRNFCVTTLADGREAYFIPRGDRVVSQELASPSANNPSFARLGGVDVWTYSSEDAAAAQTHAENVKLHSTVGSYQLKNWTWQVPHADFDYHIESQWFSPRDCAVLGDNLVSSDYRGAAGAGGWADTGKPGIQTVVDLSHMGEWPKWTAELDKTLRTPELRAQSHASYPELPMAGLMTQTTFAVPVRSPLAAVNPHANLLLYGSRPGGFYLFSFDSETRKLKPQSYFGIDPKLNFSDTQIYEAAPVVSTAITERLRYNRAIFLSDHSLIVLGTTNKVFLLDVTDPAHPLQVAVDDLKLPAGHFLVHASADLKARKLYVIVNKDLSDSPIAQRLTNYGNLKMGSPQGRSNTDISANVLLTEFERNYLVVYQWDWAE